MGRSEHLVSHNRGARLLGISRDWMTHLVTTGSLIPAVDNGTPASSKYRKDEVLAYRARHANGYTRNAAAAADLAQVC